MLARLQIPLHSCMLQEAHSCTRTHRISTCSGILTMTKKFFSYRKQTVAYKDLTKVMQRYNSSSGASQDERKKRTYKVMRIEGNRAVTEEDMELQDIVTFGANEFYARDFLSFSIAPHPNGIRPGSSPILATKLQPKISPRGDHILVTFGHIKALIGQKDGLLFDAHSPNIQVFGKELFERIGVKMKYEYASGTGTFADDDFELIFLEEILREANDVWRRRLQLYEPMVDSLLDDTVASSQQFEAEVRRIAPLKDSLRSFELHVSQNLNALKELMNDDELMLGLLLTERAAAKKRMEILDPSLHSAIENVLDNYIRQTNHLCQEINYLLMRVQSKVEFVELSIDTFRNNLITVNVYLSIGAVSLATSTAIAGFFGMNTIHGYEDSVTAFPAIVLGSAIMGGAIAYGCSRFLSRSHSRELALQQYGEMETMNKVLQDVDMGTMDLFLKVVATHEHKNASVMNRIAFRKKLAALSLEQGHELTSDEIDFLFNSMDKNDDGLLQSYEMSHLQEKKGSKDQKQLDAKEEKS